MLPNKKVVLKGQRKPVKVEDVSPAETAIEEAAKPTKEEEQSDLAATLVLQPSGP